MYLMVMFVLAALFAFALWTSPALRSPGRLAAFAALMLVHAFLHWRNPLVAERPGIAVPYLVVQGALAVALVALSANTGLALGLFPTLIGVAAGAAPDRRLAVGAVAAYLALGLWTVSWRLGWQEAGRATLMIVVSGVFAVAFAFAYRRQVHAREEVQTLLGELTGAHQRLAEHAHRIEDLTRTAERQRMARELHDTLAQGLAGVVLLVEAASGHLRDQRSSRAAEILDHALVRARQTLTEARQAIDDLRERPVPEDAEAAIRSEVDRFTRASGVPCRVEIAAIAAIDSDARQEAALIVAEALRNVARHARADAVTLSAAPADGRIDLVVEDDGVGFDLDAEETRPGHYGLVGMRERARLAGGSLRVETAPGKGTRVCLRLPVGQVA
jgi:NarL family two-component system sensor histidine kinase YdfH